MKLLLDTHILIYALNEPEKLSSLAIDKIKKALKLYVSAVSLWEMNIKIALGKLNVNMENMVTHLKKMKIQPLSITWEHAMAVQTLKPLHRDPFDRLLIAQALSEPMHLLTGDTFLSQYSDLVIAI